MFGCFLPALQSAIVPESVSVGKAKQTIAKHVLQWKPTPNNDTDTDLRTERTTIVNTLWNMCFLSFSFAYEIWCFVCNKHYFSKPEYVLAYVHCTSLHPIEMLIVLVFVILSTELFSHTLSLWPKKSEEKWQTSAVVAVFLSVCVIFFFRLMYKLFIHIKIH